MARVTITRRFPDGDVIRVQVQVKPSFPDSIAECKRAALDAYAEAFANIVPTEAGES